MNEPLQVLVPLINPNEPESLLAELRVRDGDKVIKGQVLASFETTKSTFELTADADGYILGLRFKTGDTARSGERLCYLAESVTQELPREIERSAAGRLPATEDFPEGLRITQPALALAKKHLIDLASLPRDVLITEKMITEISTACCGGCGPGSTADLRRRGARQIPYRPHSVGWAFPHPRHPG